MIRKPLILLLVLCASVFSGAPVLADSPAIKQRQAALATSTPQATQVGADILMAGGNAVDAAVAVAFALAVTLPEAGNIGGGGFMVSWMDGEAAFLDFREKAPLAARRDMFLDKQGNFVQQRSIVGALGIGVPGTVKGLQVAHERFGVLPWRALVEPAIALARAGFAVDTSLAQHAREAQEKFGQETNFTAWFGGLEAGASLRQPVLAQTLERLAADPDDFYQGHIAGQILAQMKTSGGLISAEDLEQYTAVWRAPLEFQWRGNRVLSTPPPSSGGIAVAQLLTMREFIGPWFLGLSHNSPRYVHLMAEIEKRVYADRGDYLGDPDFGEVPVAQLIDPAYLRRRAAEIQLESMSPAQTVRPGLETRHTSHFSIVDAQGNAVALTYTLNWEFGSGVVVEDAGFLLNNEMDDFSAKPGVPNAYGVIGSDMNAIAPGKRMLSSMTPTIVLRAGKPEMVLGAMGGGTIFTTVFQVMLNISDFGMDAARALSATRFHHQLPAATVIRYDANAEIADATLAGLARYGYRVEPHPWGTIGEAQLVLRQPGDGLDAAADPRGRGTARVINLPPAP